jgi:Esterase PHB depolymerase
MSHTRVRLASPRLAAVAGLLAGLAVTAAGADVVILKDGFVIQGRVSKEMTAIKDPATDKLVPVPKANGFDMVDEGPKVVIFSTHAKQLGDISKDVKIRPEYRAYTMPFNGRKSNDPLPGGAVTKASTEFDAKWHRNIDVRVPLGWERIEQQLTYIDPFYTYIISPTHLWRVAYRTSEFDPQKVRKLLSTHPELVEADGKPDASKRVAVAKFMLDIGWLQLAKDDLDKLRRDFPGGIPKDAKEAFDALAKEVEVATAGLVVREAELALGAGRYGYAGDLLSVFPEKLAEPKQVDDATKLMAQLKATRERYESGRRLLRQLLDEVTGMDKARPTLAVGGGPAAAVWPTKTLPTPLANLVAAGETIYAELHPDSAHRIEFFVNFAAQVEREKAQGRDPSKTPEELLAIAASGWAKGKNGATEKPDLALRLWTARETVLAYQRAADLNTRNATLARYKKNKPLPIDELAQVISLLPPAEPEDLLARTGTPVAAKNGIPPGIYKRTTAPNAQNPTGVPYLVKLPPEYHHGRAYPVVIALTHPTAEPEQMIASLAFESDRQGYILLAPEWSNAFGKGWQWNGEDHAYVTAVLRDAVRHFCVDNDRVFLFGAADGANMAMDVGMSHPDLFAGVLAMGPAPKWLNLFDWYWQNAQKLPFYVVTGEMSGPSIANLKQIFDKWMPYGFPAIMVVYKGRGIEWFAAETPVMFDWMGRKKRVSGTATLQLGGGPRQSWATMRNTDNRFYWLGVDKIADRHLIEHLKAKQIIPAEIQGDIRGNNLIDIRSRGVSKLSVLLTQELIDWTKPVRVTLNGATPPGYRPKVLEPDLDLLLEDYRERGDRRVLILGRLEFAAVP